MWLETMLYWINYKIILLFTSISFILAIIVLLAGGILSSANSSFEKNSAYECGFEPYNNAKIIINIQFYLIAILFLIFDLEVVVLFPWVSYLSAFSLFQHSVVILFLFILTLGFVFEWKKGALDWI